MINLLFAFLLLLVSGPPAIAGGENTETYQGIVSSTEGLPNHIIVNERRVLLDSQVEIKDHKEKDKSLSDIKNGKWIYVVAEERSSGLTAIKIYLLPGKIKDNEKHKYPFMVKEEDDE